ncbi:MAG: THxN family PEP-CTERM protein [Azoarcus sp.]|jgi:hypothetical protein|nr:THxN family PEP-CTERM protein [Azoarcus sp.]
MTKIIRKLTALSVMAFAAGAVHAAPAPTNWDYDLSLHWVNGSAKFSSGGGTQKTSLSTISWGSVLRENAPLDIWKNSNAETLRSGIVIDPRLAYSGAQTLTTNGDSVDANAFTHYNNEIAGDFKTLESAQLQLEISLVALDGYEISWTKTFDVYFKETPNVTGDKKLDGDIFSITWTGDYSETFIYDGYEYTFNYFEETDALNPLTQAACDEVKGGNNCVGFITSESAKTPVDFGFSVSAVPVPEPETYAMLLAGLGVIGAIARRRRGGIAA